MSGPTRIIPAKGSHIVVKFVNGIGLPYDDDVENNLEAYGAGSWRQVAERFPNINLRRMFTSVTPERINDLVRLAKKTHADYSQPDFLSYFIVDIHSGTDVESLLITLRSQLEVDDVYFDPPGEDAMGPVVPNPLSSTQDYLKPATEGGIDARFAWTFAGGNAAGQQFIDIEKGWTLNHEDLVAHGATVLDGQIQDGSRRHGTAALGIVCAVDNDKGIKGIAYKLEAANVVSYYHDESSDNRPNAIMKAIDVLPFGGILLLEVQLPGVTYNGKTFSKVPIEVQLADFEVIRLATALGITVIEAGGNGGLDLDTVTDSVGKFVLYKGHTDFRESGAIIVGCATSAPPHARLNFSNYGERINCYASGEKVGTVDTTTSGPVFKTNTYRTDFGGTSSASAIIAGAALVVQGLAQSNLNFRFSAFQMRKLLKDPANGTKSKDPPTDQIGVMPDFKKLISSNKIGLAPDLYIRDFIGDDGDPHNGMISASPDIILRSTPVNDPQAVFGEGSGTENSNTLGQEATAGQDNYLYVRVRNRGGTTAINAQVEVYWAPVSTLTTPDLWTKVGTANLQTVAAANVLTVFNAITWPAANIPAAGHYCFVGVVSSSTDPAPSVPAQIKWEYFQRLIRDNNNITWRNFNVVDIEPEQNSDPQGFAAMNFIAPGAPDSRQWMDLEVFACLPEGSRVLLEMPREMYAGLACRWPAVPDKNKDSNDSVLIPLNPHGLYQLGAIIFPKQARFAVRLLVHVPEKQRNSSYEVYARQLQDKLEVGRVTWRLGPVK